MCSRPASPAPPPRPSGGREIDRIEVDIGALRATGMPLTLVSTAGYHCEVWQSSGVLVGGGERRTFDFVLKRYLRPCPLSLIRVLAREHARLRDGLGDIVPTTRFVATRVDGVETVIVLCETCTPWFDLGNPANEEEALPLLARRRRATRDLRRFVEAARGWLAEDKAIDLCGTENLVVDRHNRVRYIDSFHVFLYTDVLHTLGEVDEGLTARIRTATARLRYLERVLEQLPPGA